MSRLRGAGIAVWLLATLLIWQSAWLSDDALITVRSAVNLGSGYGPVFNIDEAVAAYTHPLWFMLITAVGTLTGSWIYGVLYLNVLCASAGYFLLIRRVANWWQLVTIGLIVVLGNTALDWATSGLEGGLTLLLLGLLASIRVRHRPVLLGLIVGLLLLCRLDYALLLGPWVLVMGLDLRWSGRVRLLVGAIVPVAAWAVWAKLTYGFVLPATLEAKTNSDIPLPDLVGRGLQYVHQSATYDPVLVMVCLVFIPLLWMAGDRQSKAWIVGVGAYVLYVISVGGDYMLGRFMLAPLFVCLLEMTRTGLPRPLANRTWVSTSLLWGVTVGIAVVCVVNTRAFDWRVTEDQGDPRYPYFADERIGWTHWGRSLDPFSMVERRPPFYPTDLPFLAEQTANWPSNASTTEDPIVICHGLGGMGLLVGPSVHIIDPCGLSDRFMASLPYTPTGVWKAGHFDRPVPEGYVAAVKYNDPGEVEDEQLAARLAELWDTIRQGR